MCVQPQWQLLLLGLYWSHHPTNTLFQAIQGHPLQFISTFFRWKKKITAFLQTPIKDEGEGVPSWEKKIDIKLWSVEDVLIVGGRWEGLHFMEKNREVDRFFFRRQEFDLIECPGKGLKKWLWDIVGSPQPINHICLWLAQRSSSWMNMRE